MTVFAQPASRTSIAIRQRSSALNLLCLDHVHDIPVFKDTAEGRSTMDKLPQELIDKIISSIDQTSPSGYFALFACSRVSRAWRRQAQKGLFPDIRFMNVDQLRRWDRNVPLRSEISTYVRRLHWSVWPTEMDQPDPFLENSFPGRFSSFSNIEDLFVSNLSLRYFHTTAIERIFGHLSHSLRSLAISQLTTDPDKWCFLVSLFPNLRRISIFDTIMLEGGAPGPDHPHSFNFTGHIALYNHGTEKLFRCIAGLNPRFEAFEVHAVDGVLVDTFNLVVRSCSATLTEISITPFIMGIEGIRAVTQMDLSPCRNLRTLRMDPRIANLPEFNCLLQTICSKRFERLILGPSFRHTLSRNTNDQALHSFAERLYRLGAAEPLVMVLELDFVEEEMVSTLDAQRMWPLFSEVGVIVKNYDGSWAETLTDWYM